MSVARFEDSFRARLHAELDPHLPDLNAERRVLVGIAHDAEGRRFTSRTGGRLLPGLGGAVIAMLVVLLVGGALTVGLMLSRRVAIQGPAPARSGGAAPPAQSPATSAPGCDGDVLTARLFDRSSGVGTSGGDIALTNTGAVACTIDGYVSLAALIDGHTMELSVARIASGTVLSGVGSPVGTAHSVTLVPGYEAFVAFDVANATGAQPACPDPSALLITPPQGHRYALVSSWPLPLCAHNGVALWIDETPVSSTPYFASRG
jgi:Protein of unknown function (DUF4232)